MTRTPNRLVSGMAGTAIVMAALLGTAIRGTQAHDANHDHPPVPAAYADAHIPRRIWTDPEALARGEAIYTAKCALCHGQRGDGTGPGAASLSPKPGDLTDAKMVAEMPGKVIRLLCQVGDTVAYDQGLVVLEAMKMQTTVMAPMDGVIEAIHVGVGDTVESKDLLIRLRAAD